MSKIEMQHVFMFVLSISNSFVIPESPRWLLCKGRTAEVATIIRHACKVNKRDVPDNIEKLLRPPTKQSDTGSGCFSLFASRYLRLITFCFLCIWFTMNLVYYGLILNMNSFGGNVYLNSVSVWWWIVRLACHWFLILLLIALPSDFCACECRIQHQWRWDNATESRGRQLMLRFVVLYRTSSDFRYFFGPRGTLAVFSDFRDFLRLFLNFSEPCSELEAETEAQLDTILGTHAKAQQQPPAQNKSEKVSENMWSIIESDKVR